MKPVLLTLTLLFTLSTAAQAQFKEAAQLATLSPVIIVAQSDIDNYKKLHYTVSAMTYMGAYMITDSVWKSAVITLGLGIVKELIYDAMLRRGEPLLEDMLWNTIGTAQGVAFTLSLRF
jgi:hypothetical protein